LSYLALSYLALSYLALSYLALSYLALSYLAWLLSLVIVSLCPITSGSLPNRPDPAKNDKSILLKKSRVLVRAIPISL
jgi:hypothetical protein